MSRTVQKNSVSRLVNATRKVEAVIRMRNELLEEPPITIVAVDSYKAAYKECKEKVAKITAECRRENRRFRDHTFDLGQDDANCIYSARLSKYTAWSRELADSNYSVKKIPQIIENSKFIIDGSVPKDPLQHTPHGDKHKRRGCGGDCCKPKSHPRADNVGDAPMQSPRTGTCYFMAALATISNVPGHLNNICVEQVDDVGVYGFVFFRDGAWLSTVVDDQLVVIRAHNKYELFFGRSANPNETWVPLIEKAFAKVHYDYESLEGGIAGEAVEDLTGGVTTQILTDDILDKDKFWKETMKLVNKSVLIVANRNNRFSHLHEGETGLEVEHSYSVLRAVEEVVDGQLERLVLLRNPWGHGEWKGKWSDGDQAWTPKWMETLDHKFLNDGKFWMSYDDFLTHWDELDRTMLFTEEWSMACRWIRYDVNENKGMFRLHIKKKADTVIVLQQPDDRYLASLQQPHSRLVLSFYVYKEGATENNYLHRVRSVVKYARRSINAKLDGLEPGIYNIVPDVKKEELTEENQSKGIVFSHWQQEFMQHKRTEVLEGMTPPIASEKNHHRRRDTQSTHNMPLWEKQLGQMAEMDNILGLRVYSMDKHFTISEGSDTDEVAQAKHHNNPEDNQRVKPKPQRRSTEPTQSLSHEKTYSDAQFNISLSGKQYQDSPTEISDDFWNGEGVGVHANANTKLIHANRNHPSDASKKGVTGVPDGHTHRPHHPPAADSPKNSNENNLPPSDETNVVAIDMEPSSSMLNWVTVTKAVAQSGASENEKAGNKVPQQDGLEEKSAKPKPPMLQVGKAEVSSSRSRETPRHEPAETIVQAVLKPSEPSLDGPAKAVRAADDRGGHGSTGLGTGKAKIPKDRK